MNSKLERMAHYNKIGIIMNAVGAAVGTVLTISLVALTVVIGNSAGEWFNGIEHIDSERFIAGYEALARIFGGLGGMLLVVAFAAGALIFSIYPVLSIAALVLGVIWNKKYIKEENPGFGEGNQIAQLVLNGFLTVGILLILIGSFNFMLLIAGIYSFTITCCHCKCLLIIRE